MPVISLAELRDYANEHNDTDYDVTSVRKCLACEMLKDRLPGASVDWIAVGEANTPEIHTSYLRVIPPGFQREEHRYGIPASYIDWCVSVQDAIDKAYETEGASVPKSYYSGAELVRIINKLEAETVTLD